MQLRRAVFSLAIFSCHVSCQETSGYRGQCSEVSFNGDLSVIRAMGCTSTTTTTTTTTEMHQSQLLLDRCLSLDDSTTLLVTGQGGGYMSQSNCSSCTGVTGYTYTCECDGVSASVDLNTVLGVNATAGTICCQAGNTTAPDMQCGDYEAM